MRGFLKVFKKIKIPEISKTHPNLFHISREGSELVCEVLIKELADAVASQTPSNPPPSITSRIETGQELEWVMQVVSHSLTLPFHSQPAYETLSHAVRIYLAWCSSLTHQPHPACPLPLRTHPDLYFRRIVDSLRHVFVAREDGTLPRNGRDRLVGLKRQAAEIQGILVAVENLVEEVSEDFKDEVWARLLLFLLNVGDLMMGEAKSVGKRAKDFLNLVLTP